MRDGGGWGRRRGRAEQTILLSSSSIFVFPLFPVSRVKSDLLEVGISGHGADRCDQDDEIYIMVQAIWSGSSTFKGETVFKGRPSGNRGLAPYQRNGSCQIKKIGLHDPFPPIASGNLPISLSARNGWGHGAIAWGNLHIRVRGGKRRAPNGVCHSWEHGCALGVARDAVCPSGIL